MSRSGQFFRRLNNIRVKLIVVPLLLLALAVAVLGFVTFGFVRTTMLRGMQDLGTDIAKQAAARLADNRAALDMLDLAMRHTVSQNESA